MSASEDLARIAQQIEQAALRIAELQAAKKALTPQRKTITALCEKLGVTPTKESIGSAKEEASTSLTTLIQEIDRTLKEL